jgi:hypothetical protein
MEVAFCLTCSKKLRSVQKITNQCRCNQFFCNDHLHKHECDYDHRKIYQERMMKDLPKIVAQKILKC